LNLSGQLNGCNGASLVLDREAVTGSFQSVLPVVSAFVKTRKSGALVTVCFLSATVTTITNWLHLASTPTAGHTNSSQNQSTRFRSFIVEQRRFDENTLRLKQKLVRQYGEQKPTITSGIQLAR
jgi:hypothetical protein